MYLRYFIFSSIWLLSLSFNQLNAQTQRSGSVSGIIIERESHNAMEFANIILKRDPDSSIVDGAISDKNGKFSFDNVPFGRYKITYSFIGFESRKTPVFTVDDQHKVVNLGSLAISSTTSSLNEVVVTGERSTYVNSIDRKVFNVGKDLISKTGSVSDLMQNIPSVTVDIDGVVSLRGSSSVMILINGKPSALMGANRAAVLQQMPANSIERIEVITNPSAKYKPDGTSGIINIVLKKNKLLGFNGTLTGNAGNENRYNGNIIANYNPGKINVFGSYSIRQDDRFRYTDDQRTKIDTNTLSQTYSTLYSTDHSRPLSHIISTGIDYKINDNNTIGINGSFNYRDFIRDKTDLNKSFDNGHSITKDYERINKGPQSEKDLEIGATMQHSFQKEGHELNLDFVASKSDEIEDNHYIDNYRLPVTPSTFDNTMIRQFDTESQLSLEYINPLSETANLEAGYIYEYQKSDMDFYGEFFNLPTNIWEKDIAKSNRFIYTSGIHVLYGTFEKTLGKFGFLAGLRGEDAFVNSNQVTTDTIIKNSYLRLYPSLHLAYMINDEHELQINYSHRISRPEGDELNPFPEYSDPYNLSMGNPHLKPAETHSVEMGYQVKKEKTTFLSTLYYRYAYNNKTSITRYINDTVLLTTTENLSKSSSAGLELVLASQIGEKLNVNLSTNTFYNVIDASRLGYGKKKSIISWSANLSANYNITKSTVLQITSNYIAKRLTPQGEMSQSFVFNTGFKQELFKSKAALILTISDLFNSMRNNSILDIPVLKQTVIRRRSARIIYAGFTWTFGNQNTKGKETKLNYDVQ